MHCTFAQTAGQSAKGSHFGLYRGPLTTRHPCPSQDMWTDLWSVVSLLFLSRTEVVHYFFRLWLGMLLSTGMEGRGNENTGIPAFSISKQKEECEEEDKFARTDTEKKRADKPSLRGALYSLSVLCN